MLDWGFVIPWGVFLLHNFWMFIFFLHIIKNTDSYDYFLLQRSSRRVQGIVAVESFEKWRLSTSVKETGKCIYSHIFPFALLKKKHNHTISNLWVISLLRNILELIQFFEDSSCFYLVFEKLRGGKNE